MTITIYKQDLVDDIQLKSHYNVQGVEDVEARYKLEAGSEKIQEITQCLQSARSVLHTYLSRYLVMEQSASADNSLGLPERFVWELEFTERRADNKAQSLADAIHAFLVDSALAAFYTSVSANDLVTKYTNMVAIDTNILMTTLYQKQPPV